MQPKSTIHYLSVADYLQLEDAAEERSEYCNGEIFTMAGGTPNHNQISGNVYVELNIALKKQNYRVYIADVKLWIPQRNNFKYPDVMIIEGQPQYYENRKDILLNPIVIIEVLSNSTKDYDRGDKFQQYRTLESLQHYILINQDSIQVEHFKKIAPFEWLLTELNQPEATLKLTNPDLTLALSDIYDRVDLSPSAMS
jgi:Uma2 family endonuclease